MKFWFILLFENNFSTWAALDVLQVWFCKTTFSRFILWIIMLSGFFLVACWVWKTLNHPGKSCHSRRSLDSKTHHLHMTYQKDLLSIWRTRVYEKEVKLVTGWFHMDVSINYVSSILWWRDFIIADKCIGKRCQPNWLSDNECMIHS